MTIYSLDVLLYQFGKSVVPCPVLTAASWPAYRGLRRQVRWSGISISLRIFHSLLWSTQSVFGMVNKAEVDVFLELSCFFDDPTDVGNLISDSSAFSKSSLNIWKFMVHVLLKPGLENFEHYFASLWEECNCAVVWAFFGTTFLWGWNDKWPFPVLWPLLSFPNVLHIECSTFTASSFRVSNRLKLKKVGKTTRPFRYDLNQIPYNYTVEVTSRFKGLDLIDRVPEELWMEVRDVVQEAVIKTILKKKKWEKEKLLSEEALQISEKQKPKEKRKNIPIWMQSSKE